MTKKGIEMHCKYKLILIILFLSGFFYSCKKQFKHYYVNAGLLANCSYKVGSYWIYRDSITGLTDSLYVTKSLLYTVTDNQNNNYSDTYIIWLNFGNVDSANIESWQYNLFGNDFVLCKMFNPNDFVEQQMEYLLFFYPIADSTIGLYNVVNTFNKINQIEINGIQYTNVVLSHSIPTSSYLNSLNYDDYIYSSLTTGIIKFVFNHPTDSVHRVMELERYHIII